MSNKLINNLIINDIVNIELNSILEVNDLITHKTKINELIQNYKIIIQHYDNVLASINNKIYNKCNHKWTIDHSYHNENTEYICTICNLNKYK